LSLTILKIVGLGAAITAASIISPPFLYILVKGCLKHKLKRKYTKHDIQKSLNYLKRKKYIAYEKNGSKIGNLILTRVGRRHLARINLEDIKLTKTSWDNKWRFLLFDITEGSRAKRDVLRKKLKSLGFYHFQRSVFVTPYPCEKEINSIKLLLGLKSSIYLITAGRFPGDAGLVKRLVQKSN